MARACGLELGAWGFHPQAWRLQGLAVDRDPWAMLSPVIAHDLEFRCYGLELPSGCAFNFYCKFFHFFLFSFQALNSSCSACSKLASLTSASIT